MRTRPLASVILLGALTLAPLALAPPCVRAHRGSMKELLVERTPSGARVDVRLEVVDAAVELELAEDAGADAVLARGEELGRVMAAGVTIASSVGACGATVTAPAEPFEAESGPAKLTLTLDYECPADARDLVLRDATVFPTDAQHEAWVRVRFAEGDAREVLRAGRQEASLGEPPSVFRLLEVFVVEGVLHLVTGYDHLLFLLSLVLTAGALARKKGMRAALRDVALVVTAFTVGHSITLIAAALGVVVLPSRLVESVIAASIVVVAALNVWRPDRREGMPLLALGFGLVHGFGFSSVLAEVGLPARARVLSLLAFNVGIELAQLAFVAALLYPLAWLAGRPGYRTWIVRGGSVLIGLLAFFWLIERATGA